MTKKKRAPDRRWIAGHTLLGQALWIFGALPTLWFVISIMTGVGFYVSLKIQLIVVVGFGLIFIFMGLVGRLAGLSKRIKEKTIKPLCPKCFTRMPINFVCRCSPGELLPLVTYFSGGLFYNRCRACSGEFHKGSLRGKCISCGAVIENWRLFMFRRGQIVVTIENSLDRNPENGRDNRETGSYHEKVSGCEHYIRKPRKNRVQHWFRWVHSLDAAAISQDLSEKIDAVWLDKECGTSGWAKTNTILSSIRKDIRKITYGFAGKEDELRAGSLGIKGTKITYGISLEDFLDQS